ncbi:uncharacterized protein LOC124156895 [Ischnura elegans]|uniref:uncharacterized protein LOC124156895 n=1 Tax=Ischnura elegans TaxID=197161 RepID=UPI001ED87707|nr:uncharacterized protein LOC124156895 [Ischnura elegans]XP_046387339.1 uncharacterized protein LOC124156895 [Ischnura elegans]
MELRRTVAWLLLFAVVVTGTTTDGGEGDRRIVGGEEEKEEGASQKPHSRQKRLLWLTRDGRLALPPGTTLIISPSLSLPFVRYPPEGFLSNMTISLPFTIEFDKLGLTDNANPYGALPPLFARSLGRMSGSLMAEYVGSLIGKIRGKRDAEGEDDRGQQPGFEGAFHDPKAPTNLFHGGERAILYGVLEEFLSNFGMDGRACLLRAICEVHGHPLTSFGLLGEFVKLFFTASKSPFASVLEEYVAAEKAGMDDGDCWRYYKKCPKSLFLWKERNKYTEDAAKDHEDDTDDMNEVAASGERRQVRTATKITLDHASPDLTSQAM